MNNIFHMASMARSGETLVLKILAQHENIAVVHNLGATDSPQEERAFKFLKNFSGTSIDRENSAFDGLGLVGDQVLLVKQGVWRHAHKFKGFILSRNPFSIYSSLKSYDKDHCDYNSDNNFWFNNERRLVLWMEQVDRNSVKLLKSLSPVEQFSLFYNTRMGQLIDDKLPILRYEDLVSDLRCSLEKVCNILGVEMSEKLLCAHDFYEKGAVGHGGIDLSEAVDVRRNEKYKENLTKKEFEYISKNTQSVFSLYGYEVKGCNVIAR